MITQLGFTETSQWTKHTHLHYPQRWQRLNPHRATPSLGWLKAHFEEHTESPQIPWWRALSEALLNIQIPGPQTDLLITNISGKVLRIRVYVNSPKWSLSSDKARKYCSGKISIIFSGSVPAVLGGPNDQSAGHLFICCQWFVKKQGLKEVWCQRAQAPSLAVDRYSRWRRIMRDWGVKRKGLGISVTVTDRVSFWPQHAACGIIFLCQGLNLAPGSGSVTFQPLYHQGIPLTPP